MNKTHAQSFKLKPSSIPGAGVGVFALHDIDVGVLLALKPSHKIGITLQKADIAEDLLAYCINNGDGTYHCPPEFNHMLIILTKHLLSTLDILRKVQQGTSFSENFELFELSMRRYP